MKRTFNPIATALKQVKRRARPSSSVIVLLLAITLAPLALPPVLARAPQDENLIKVARECIQRSEYEKAVRLAEQIVAAARESGDRGKEAAGFELIGDACFYLDRNSEALEAFQSHLRVAREIGDRDAEASALKNLAITYKRFSRFDEAFEMMQQALQIFRQQNDSYGVASTLENLGMSYSGLGAYNQAFDMYSEALTIARRDQDAKLMFGALVRMGQLYITMKIPTRAIDCLKEAVAISQQQEFSPLDRIWGIQIMNMALASDGRFEEAIALLKKALILCRQIAWKTGEAETLQGLAYNSLDIGEPAVALNYLKQSLALLEEVNFQQLWNIYSGLGNTYRRLGDLDRAVAYYQKAVAQLESFRFRLSSEQQRATFLGKHRQIYQDLLQSLIERYERHGNRGDDIQAFAAYEQGKARAMVEAIAEARLDIEQELEPELRSRREALKARIAELHKNLVAAEGKAPQRRQMVASLAEAERDFDQLIIEIKRRNPHYAKVHYPTPLQLQEAQALLDKRTAMIAYAMTRDSLFAFVLTENSFRVTRLKVSPDVLASRVQNYVDLINQGDEHGWQGVSARLYAELIAPIREGLSPTIHRLVIAPDGALCFLPFETLQNATENRSPFLLEDFAVSYVPSATVLAQLQTSGDAQSTPWRENLLLLAHPTIAASLHNPGGAPKDYARLLYEEEGLEISPLPFSAEEARRVAFYAGAHSRIFTDGQATEHLIKTNRLDTFRVLHFATHGLVSQRHPLRSALVLASAEGDGEDGFLQAREILQLKLKNDLVVLSACQTARGQILAGEGVQGLAQAFLNAGAQSVIASLWNVNDQRAALFMEGFYRQLANGQNKVEALRSAKLELLKDDFTSSPRYWAAFVLVGEAQGKIPVATPSLWLRYRKFLLALALTLTLLAALLMLRKKTSK
jgi:CHAT domain-containing protein/Flp pilus assembly protein TadD